MRNGEKPQARPPLQTTQQDEYGNVLGGVRIQEIDVPIATDTNSNGAVNLLDIISALAEDSPIPN